MHKMNLVILAVVLAVAYNARAETPTSPENYYQVITDSTFETETGYRSEFGYAVFVQFEGARVLFDTGVTPGVLEQNLRTAGIDPKSIGVLVLSHNHRDHIGGISYIRKTHPEIKVYAPPKQEVDGQPVTRLTDTAQITPNLFALSTHTDVPTVGISDELSLVLRTKNGPYLLTACSHTGVAGIINKAAGITGQRIFHYTGGARLKFRGTEDTQQVARELNELNVSQISPGHCSVDHAVDRTLSKYFHGRVLTSLQGRKVALTPPDRR